MRIGDFKALVGVADEIIAALRNGDLAPDEAVAAWESERARIKGLCGRCEYENLSGCGAGIGYPACVELRVSERSEERAT